MGLFKPAWQSYDKEKALAAVEKLTNQTKLAHAALKAYDYSVRLKATKKLINQTVLAEIVKYDSWREVKFAAIEKLTDQVVLTESAIRLEGELIYEDVCMAAVAKLTDQYALVKVAKHGVYVTVRMAATDKIANQNLAQEMYADIAKTNQPSAVSVAAAEKLSDKNLAQEAYIYIAKNAWSDDVRDMARKKITDQNVLAEFRRKDEEKEAYIKSIIRGKFGEPYCSKKCMERASDIVYRVFKGSHSSKCHYCPQTVFYGNSRPTTMLPANVVLVDGEPMFFCRDEYGKECENKARAFFKDHRNCCMCKKKLY